jgi:hypothetical protein
MYGLVYPAVLGSLLYLFGEQVAQGTFSLSLPIPWIAGALFIAVFALDYVYSLSRTNQEFYSGFAFSVDALLLVVVYLSAQAIFGTKILSCVSVWFWLLLAKVVSLYQELLLTKAATTRDPPEGRAPAQPLGQSRSDLMLAFVCGISWAIAAGLPIEWGGLPLVMFLAIDAYFYLVFIRGDA